MRVSEKHCPWVDKELKEFMRTRDKPNKSAVKSKSPGIVDSYRKIHNKVISLNTQLKKGYYNNKILAYSMKEFRQTFNELLNKRSKSSKMNCLKESGWLKEDTPGVMNTSFCSVGKDNADKISTTPNPFLSCNLNRKK